MTEVLVDLRRAAQDGTDVPASGTLICKPTARREVAAYVVLPESFTVKLVDGKATLELAPTLDGIWAWEIVERINRGKRRYVTVPDSPTPLNYGDLQDVDPTTLDPTSPLTPAWQTYLVNYVESAITDLINGAPGALDTLKELADALGDDPNFAAAITTQLGLKATTTDLSAETAARVQAIVDEVTARNTAISSAISTEVTNRNSAIATATTGMETTTGSAAKVAAEAVLRDTGDQTIAGVLSTYATTNDAAVALKANAISTAASIATKNNRDLPSYIPSTVTSVYDPRFNSYNFKPTNTRKLRAGMSRAMAGGLCEMLVFSDSAGAGCTNGPSLTFDRLRAYPISARDELARHGVPVGGTGLVRITDAGTSQDSRWAAAGVWSSTGKWYAFTAAANATATFTTNLAGDKFGLLYYDVGDGATFTISVNGAVSGSGFTTITCSGSPVGLKMAVLTTTVAATNAIVMKKLTGTGLMDIVGAQVWNSAVGGLVVHNLSQSSSTAAGTGAAAWVDTAATSLGYLTNQGKLSTDGTKTPDLVIVALGGNDHPNTTTPIATITAALSTLRTRFASSDFLLIIENQVIDSVVLAADWEAYAAAVYALADSLDVPLVDFRARLGNYTTTVTNGLSTDGQGHLSAGAYCDLGRNLGMLLAS